MGFVDPIEYELARERAGGLGRLGRKLEAALAKLEALDAAPEAHGYAARREELLWELAEIVMFVLVAREACGLRNADFVLRHYGVPREVIARLGVRRPPRAAGGAA